MRTRATAAAALAVTALVGIGASAASAVPEMRLPDATLYCGNVVVAPTEWVVVTPATLWIKTGSLAGHYATLAYTHYVVPGVLTEPPASYAGLGFAGEKTFGTKEGLQPNAMTCDIVSRFTYAPEPFSIVGPITISKVSG